MSLDKIELHDALIQSVVFDIEAATVSISLLVYGEENSKTRHPLLIRFEEVETISSVADCIALKKNKFAGNISYWIPNEKGGLTFIYLADGIFAIKSGKISIEQSGEQPKTAGAAPN